MDSYDPAGVLPGEAWRKASFCGPNGGNCLEVNLAVQGVAGLRDSKAGAGPALLFADPKWGLFLDAAKAGLLDRR